MYKLDNLKSYILSRIFGLISLIIAIFLFVSLLGFNESDKFKIQIPINNETTRIKKLLYLMPKIDFMPMMRKKNGIKYEE